MGELVRAAVGVSFLTVCRLVVCFEVASRGGALAFLLHIRFACVYWNPSSLSSRRLERVLHSHCNDTWDSGARRSSMTQCLPRVTESEAGHDGQNNNCRGVEALVQQEAGTYQVQDHRSLALRGRSGGVARRLLNQPAFFILGAVPYTAKNVSLAGLPAQTGNLHLPTLRTNSPRVCGTVADLTSHGRPPWTAVGGRTQPS